jgi:hypothetical protein
VWPQILPLAVGMGLCTRDIGFGSVDVNQYGRRV